MATYTTALHDEGQATAFADEGPVEIYDRFTVSTALAINDVIRSAYIPKFAVILDGKIVTDDLDTNGTPLITLTYRINNGTTQRNFFSASTVGRAGGIQRADAGASATAACGFEVTASGFFLELLVPAAPATGATAVEIRFFCRYTNRRINADL